MSTSACAIILARHSASKSMSVGRHAALLAVEHEQPAIRVEQVVGGLAAERLRRCRRCRARRLRSRRTRRPAFRRSRRCSRRSRTPRGTSGSETRRGIRAPRGCCSSRGPSPTTVSISSRILTVGRLHRSFEGQQAPAAVHADPQRRAPAVEVFVAGVEQAVFLQPPAVNRRGAGGQNGRAGGFGAVESQLDLALEDCGHEAPI